MFNSTATSFLLCVEIKFLSLSPACFYLYDDFSNFGQTKFAQKGRIKNKILKC